jgi:hypothetical protein
MSSTEHDELKHASEMLAKLQAHHRARADELHTSCEAQRECTRLRLAELAAAHGTLPVAANPEEPDHS